jgi:hypothetical protein
VVPTEANLPLVKPIKEIIAMIADGVVKERSCIVYFLSQSST